MSRLESSFAKTPALCIRSNYPLYFDSSKCIIRYTGKLRYPCIERALSVIHSTFGTNVDPWECLDMVNKLWTPAECMILGI